VECNDLQLGFETRRLCDSRSQVGLRFEVAEPCGRADSCKGECCRVGNRIFLLSDRNRLAWRLELQLARASDIGACRSTDANCAVQVRNRERRRCSARSRPQVRARPIDVRSFIRDVLRRRRGTASRSCRDEARSGCVLLKRWPGELIRVAQIEELCRSEIILHRSCLTPHARSINREVRELKDRQAADGSRTVARNL